MNINEKMALTIDLAEYALNQGELPIAAYVFSGDKIISKAFTSEKTDNRFLVHAELKALLMADRKNIDISDRKKMQLFSTLEPCIMCYGAAMSGFIGEIYYSLNAPEDGALRLINFNNFLSDYLKYQKPRIKGSILSEKSKSLFIDYAKIISKKTLYDFTMKIIENN
jgi:tRNA(adenine34) deaminase